MKTSTALLLSISLAFVLTACAPKDTVIELNKDGSLKQPTPVAEENSDDSQAASDPLDMKTQVDDANTKYLDPKIATLRTPKYVAKGKVKMQHDQKEDKTYFWTGVEKWEPAAEGKRYVVWLQNNKAKETDKKLINVGTLRINEEGVGYLYYEFPDKGNMYDYLKVLVSEEAAEGDPTGETRLFEANFSAQLN